MKSKMFSKYDISHCTQKEIDVLNEFKNEHPDKPVTVYYSVYNTLGIGYNLIATIDEPVVIDETQCDFGRCVDITDYSTRYYEF